MSAYWNARTKLYKEAAMIKNKSNVEKIDKNLWFTEEEKNNYKINYRINNITFDDCSSYQHIMIADSPDFGPMLILDGVVQTTSADGFIYNEMLAHIPMCSHPDPKKILIVGGGDCGVAREITKYPCVEKIDMVEIDEMVVKACKEHLKEVSGNLNDKRVNFIYADGIKYVKECRDKYDVVIIDSSDPVGPAVELFSMDFYNNISNILKDDGIFACQSESPIFYADEMKDIFIKLSDIYNEVKVCTAVVPTYPGGLWSFTIGSKESINTKPERLCGDNQYVNAGILKSCFYLPEFVNKALGAGL